MNAVGHGRPPLVREFWPVIQRSVGAGRGGSKCGAGDRALTLPAVMGDASTDREPADGDQKDADKSVGGFRLRIKFEDERPTSTRICRHPCCARPSPSPNYGDQRTRELALFSVGEPPSPAGRRRKRTPNPNHWQSANRGYALRNPAGQGWGSHGRGAAVWTPGLVRSGRGSRDAGRVLRRFAERQVVDRGIARGELLTTEQAVQYLGIRRSDFVHLTRAGWLRAVTREGSGHTLCGGRPMVYGKADLDAVLADPRIEWAEVRAAAWYRPSPLTRLRSRREHIT